jgi:hypothetical protein
LRVGPLAFCSSTKYNTFRTGVGFYVRSIIEDDSESLSLGATPDCSIMRLPQNFGVGMTMS